VIAGATAFAPGNISCIFKVVAHPDPRKMHSLGMGFTVRDGVTATVREADRTTVSFNGQDIDFPTVVLSVARLTSRPVRVELETELQLSGGFGLSGASALAVSCALNHLFELGKSEHELAMIAHVAEVENLTGLGDVCAQYHGGCLVKLTVGDPLAAERLPVPEQPIYYRYFGPIHTREILADVDRRARINGAADRALSRLTEVVKLDTVDFGACVQLSRDFAMESGLMSDARVRSVVEEIEDAGGSASMIMLGHAVFSTRPFADARETRLGVHRMGLV
jgi:pantoate kinase